MEKVYCLNIYEGRKNPCFSQAKIFQRPKYLWKILRVSWSDLHMRLRFAVDAEFDWSQGLCLISLCWHSRSHLLVVTLTLPSPPIKYHFNWKPHPLYVFVLFFILAITHQISSLPFLCLIDLISSFLLHCSITQYIYILLNKNINIAIRISWILVGIRF